jgi:pSer/pThr/pTyr-binding forkhead associated (FHA) protein
MGKLVLKFDDQVLKEVPLGSLPISIGRAPDNDIPIDNLSVSNYHARVYPETGKWVVEDLESLNGTFLNNSRVKKQNLSSGDSILIGKHTILMDEANDVYLFDTERKVVAPKVDETVVLDTQKRAELWKRNGGSANAQASRARVPSVIVTKGKADRESYLLSSKLVVIGKSPLATVRLRGWFAPQVAAQISQRPDGYYLIRTSKRFPKVNGQTVQASVKLNDGDRIEIGRVTLQFVFGD